MALSHKHRTAIYQKLSPILGDEEADALLSQFPARDLDEPVTREFVRAEIAGVRAELAGFKTEVAAEFGAVRTEMAQMETRLGERFRQQTIWIASSTTVAVGLATALARLIG